MLADLRETGGLRPADRPIGRVVMDGTGAGTDAPTLLVRACPLCGTSALNSPPLPHAVAPWRIKRCPACGFVFLENAPSYATVREHFPWEKTYPSRKQRRESSYAHAFNLLRRIAAAISRATKNHLRPHKLGRCCRRGFRGGTILDLGCDLGYNAQFLAPACRPIGIEIVPALARAAAPVYEARGGRVLCCDVRSGLASLEAGSCDGAIAKSYLEHELDPGGVLRELHRVLTPDSALVIKVPNYACVNRVVRGRGWCGFRLPDHVNYFTRSTLTRMLHRHGFRVEVMAFMDWLPTSDSLWCIARKGLRSDDPGS